jgi:hypothetical protein
MVAINEPRPDPVAAIRAADEGAALDEFTEWPKCGGDGKPCPVDDLGQGEVGLVWAEAPRMDSARPVIDGDVSARRFISGTALPSLRWRWLLDAGWRLHRCGPTLSQAGSRVTVVMPNPAMYSLIGR